VVEDTQTTTTRESSALKSDVSSRALPELPHWTEEQPQA
jgi:hypothetical protein